MLNTGGLVKDLLKGTPAQILPVLSRSRGGRVTVPVPVPVLSLSLAFPSHTAADEGFLLQLSDGLTVIPEYDWKLFSEEWSATPGKSIYAEIAFSKNIQDKLHMASEAMPIMDGKLDQSLDDANDDLRAREPYLKTDPEFPFILLVCDVLETVSTLVDDKRKRSNVVLSQSTKILWKQFFMRFV
ncbi:uncharacterized protein LOC120648235 [Panicum virgatum]|uniref:Uncharacterized protein n=1 Tax=Panicum virgatum TaxID=38727 RepID=A0A8T0P0C2_PANVG|nr:uncharacterized protein LOC120648235 [Panicum virgatum]KAG2554119.1 hypothetical protein PVAP13_9KG642700 [Panicum virgatum]